VIGPIPVNGGDDIQATESPGGTMFDSISAPPYSGPGRSKVEDVAVKFTETLQWDHYGLGQHS